MDSPASAAPDAAQPAPEALAEALTQLRDIYLPQPRDDWGISDNTWATVVILAIAGLGAAAVRRYVTRSSRHMALQAIVEIRRAHRRGQTKRATLRECAVLIRRTALALYPPGEVAGLTGSGWLDFLDRTGGGEFFRSGAGQVLGAGPFGRGAPHYDADALLDGLEQWMRTAATPHERWFDRLLRPRQGLPPLYP